MKVYFDLDGVLADFNKGLIDICNVQPCDQTAETTAASRAMWEAKSKTKNIYDRLDLMPGAKEMFDFVYGLLGDDCQILSGIPKQQRGITTACLDKTNWVQRMLSSDVKINLVYKEQKKDFCTGRDCILVDDLDGNIESWEQCGGTGILHKDSQTSIMRLKEIMFT